MYARGMFWIILLTDMGQLFIEYRIIVICVCCMVVTTSKMILHQFLVKDAQLLIII